MMKMNKIVVLSLISLMLLPALSAHTMLEGNVEKYAREATFQASRFIAGMLARKGLDKLNDVVGSGYDRSIPRASIRSGAQNFVALATAGVAPQGLNHITRKSFPPLLAWLAQKNEQPNTAGRVAFWAGMALGGRGQLLAQAAAVARMPHLVYV